MHPLAKTVAACAKNEMRNTHTENAMPQHETEEHIDNFNNISGEGMTFTVQGAEYWVGNALLARNNGADVSQLPPSAGQSGNIADTTQVYFGQGSTILAAMSVKDELNATAVEAVRLLRAKEKKIILLSGDNAAAAHEVGDKIKADEVISAALPDDKRLCVERLRNAGHTVAMIGDGTNDSEALASADIGIAMGNGTDVAVNSAQIVMMSDNLTDIDRAFNLSHEATNLIRRNLFWAFIYNIIGIPVAAGVLYPITGTLLSPMIAAAAMACSSVSVVLSSLTLYTKKL